MVEFDGEDKGTGADIIDWYCGMYKHMASCTSAFGKARKDVKSCIITVHEDNIEFRHHETMDHYANLKKSSSRET